MLENINNELIQTSVCRICLEEDSEDNMIYPCRCQGTSKYVHKNCLNQWRLMSENPDALTTCSVCIFKYIVSDTIGVPTNFIYKCMKHISSNLVIFLLFNIYIVFTITMFLKMVDINNILTKYYLNETQVIFNTNISSIEEFEKSGYYDIYTLFASTIYLIGLFVIGFIMIILSDINKCMYIKYVCRNQRTWFTLTLFIFTFFFFYK